MKPFATRSRALAAWLLCAFWLGGLPSSAPAQELIGAGDIVQIESPEPDHRIAYGDDPLQFGNLRLPEGDGPHPVVAFVHGGCWLSMYDIAHVGPAEQAIADAGFAVWSIEYRRVGDEGGGWPATYLDVGRGFDHLRELSGPYQCGAQKSPKDPNHRNDFRAIVIGTSGDVFTRKTLSHYRERFNLMPAEFGCHRLPGC